MAAVHARSIHRHAHAHLCVIVDPTVEARQALASVHAASTASTLDEAFTSHRIDAVVIASPSETHADYIEACAKAGLPVLCEKPVDLSLDRVDRCLRSVAGTDVPIVIGFHRRFDAPRAEIREWARNGTLGTLRQVTQISRDPRLPGAMFLAHSGGMVRDMLIHDLDELIWLVGDGPVTVFAELRRSADELAAIGDHDLASISISFERGPQCSIFASRQCEYGFDQRLEVFGTRGMASCPSMHASMALRAGHDGFLQARLLDHFPERYAEAYRAEFDHFVRVARGEEASRCTVQDARLSLALAEMALSSHRSGLPVRASTLTDFSGPTG